MDKSWIERFCFSRLASITLQFVLRSIEIGMSFVIKFNNLIVVQQFAYYSGRFLLIHII